MVSIVANDGYTIQNMAADNNKRNYSALYGYLSIFSRKRKMGLSYPHSYTLCDVRRLHFRNHVFGLFLCA